MQVGKTELRYHLRALDDLAAILREHGDWMPLGSADEGKPAGDGTVEAWARSEDNPVGSWYGLKKALRGRFANYVPPVLKQLGTVEVEHKARGTACAPADPPSRSPGANLPAGTGWIPHRPIRSRAPCPARRARAP